jgi:hypothetical protein
MILTVDTDSREVRITERPGCRPVSGFLREARFSRAGAERYDEIDLSIAVLGETPESPAAEVSTSTTTSTSTTPPVRRFNPHE